MIHGESSVPSTSSKILLTYVLSNTSITDYSNLKVSEFYHVYKKYRIIFKEELQM